jgi:hypothetical protein
MASTTTMADHDASVFHTIATGTFSASYSLNIISIEAPLL